MRGKLLPLLLALCLMLTACGAPSVSELPDDAAPESQPSVPAFDFQAEGLPLSELLAQAAADHKDSMTLRITQQDAAAYFPDDPASASLLTDAEITSLLMQRDTVDTVSREEALSDTDLLFRALHAAYGAYYYFGAARFDAAQAAVTDWLSEQERVSVNELGARLQQELLFMLENDAHAMIWEPTPSEQVRYEYFYVEGLEFGQDDIGYFTEKDGVRWYVDGFSDSRVSLRPTLMADGRVVCAPVLFCTRPTVTGSTVTLRSEAGETAVCDLIWTESRALREGNHQVDYKLLQESGLTYISVRDFDRSDWADTLTAYAADAIKARGSTAIIYDLRSNGGGDDQWSNQWVQNYTGIPERIPEPVFFANKNSALAKAQYDVRGGRHWGPGKLRVIRCRRKSGKPQTAQCDTDPDPDGRCLRLIGRKRAALSAYAGQHPRDRQQFGGVSALRQCGRLFSALQRNLLPVRDLSPPVRRRRRCGLPRLGAGCLVRPAECAARGAGPAAKRRHRRWRGL